MRKLFVISVAFIATFLIAASSASAAYTRVLPNGLSSSPQAAAKQVQDLVSTDAGVQASLAKYNGLSANEIASAKVSNVAPTSVTIGKSDDNSARDNVTGAIVPSSYMYGQTVAAWKVTLTVSKTKTVVVKWKKDCSNPFLPKGPVRPPLRITTYSKTFVMPYKGSKTVTRTITCPSGQRVTIPVTVKVKGRVRVTSITKGAKVLSQRFTTRLREQIRVVIKAKCGTAPAPRVVERQVPVPTPTPTPPAPVPPTPEQPVNQIPSCEKVKTPEHIYPGKGYEIKFRCIDPEGSRLTIYAEPDWGQLTFVRQDGDVYTYHYSASYADGTPLEPGYESITVIAMDSLEAVNAPMYINFPIPRDER